MEQLPIELQEFNKRMEARVLELKERRRRVTCVPPKVKVTNRGRKAVLVNNPFVGLRALLRDSDDLVRAYGYPAWLDDVLQGVARLDWYRTNGRSIPLSVRRMLLILDQLSVITAAEVAPLLLVEVRQAQRYVQALRLAMPHLIAGMPVGTLERIAGLLSDSEMFDDEEEAAGVAVCSVELTSQYIRDHQDD